MATATRTKKVNKFGEDSMSSVTARRNQGKLAEQIYRHTHFRKDDVIELLQLYPQYLGNDRMDRTKFREILHNQFKLTDDILMDRVFKAFDKDNDGTVSMQEWVLGLSVVLKGTLEEKMEFCFDVYDLNSDGYISREEANHMLKNCIVKQQSDEDADEGVKDLADFAFKMLDADHDGRVSFNDYKESVLREPLLLQSFGPCLPDSEHVREFSKTFASPT